MENNGIRRPFVASAETAPMRFQNIADFDVRDCRLNIVSRTRERQRSRQELDQHGQSGKDLLESFLIDCGVKGVSAEKIITRRRSNSVV